MPNMDGTGPFGTGGCIRKSDDGITFNPGPFQAPDPVADVDAVNWEDVSWDGDGEQQW